MSNRMNGFSPRDGQVQDMLAAAHQQGQREGAQAVLQKLNGSFPAIFQTELGPPTHGKSGRDITGREFLELAQPITIGLPGQMHIVGGMTTRLVVASQIVGHCSAHGLNNEDACRTSLILADDLIMMEREQREAAREAAKVAAETHSKEPNEDS